MHACTYVCTYCVCTCDVHVETEAPCKQNNLTAVAVSPRWVPGDRKVMDAVATVKE